MSWQGLKPVGEERKVWKEEERKNEMGWRQRVSCSLKFMVWFSSNTKIVVMMNCVLCSSLHYFLFSSERALYFKALECGSNIQQCWEWRAQYIFSVPDAEMILKKQWETCVKCNYTSDSVFIFPVGVRTNASLSSCLVLVAIKKLFGGLNHQDVIGHCF